MSNTAPQFIAFIDLVAGEKIDAAQALTTGDGVFARSDGSQYEFWRHGSGGEPWFKLIEADNYAKEISPECFLQGAELSAAELTDWASSGTFERAGDVFTFWRVGAGDATP